MPSATPKADVSVTDHRWHRPCCRYAHGPTVACPPAEQWLMAWSKHINGRRR